MFSSMRVKHDTYHFHSYNNKHQFFFFPPSQEYSNMQVTEIKLEILGMLRQCVINLIFCWSISTIQFHWIKNSGNTKRMWYSHWKIYHFPHTPSPSIFFKFWKHHVTQRDTKLSDQPGYTLNPIQSPGENFQRKL